MRPAQSDSSVLSESRSAERMEQAIRRVRLAQPASPVHAKELEFDWEIVMQARLGGKFVMLFGSWILAVGSALGQAQAEDPTPIRSSGQTPTELPATSPESAVEPEKIGEAQQKTGEGQPCTNACADCFDWSKVPPVRVIPRTGNFAIPPKGPGYYSLLDLIKGNYREGPSKYPYPPFAFIQPPFYDMDFRYLDDPNNTDVDYADCLKRIHLGDNWLFSTGGQVWNRYAHEDHARLSRIDNGYDLLRGRIYGDLWFRDQFRLYAEFLSAYSFAHELVPLPIDRDPADFLNLFLDVKLMNLADHPVYARIGRQEVLLGSQRLITTLDWAATRRTFDGARVFRQGEKFDVDLFWLQPVIPNPQGWSSVDHNINFAGMWTTYRPRKGTALDLYYLFLDNSSRIVQQGLIRSPNSVHTIGSRYSGDQDGFLWDFEGAVQLGERGQKNIIAGMATAGLGYNLANSRLNPSFWIYYDYASGTRNTAGGTSSTFNQLFAFGHYYLGWADQVGRQNIHDLNASVTLFPTKWINLQMQYHHFWLASATDALYGAAGLAIRRSATGAAGTNVGDELDFLVNFHLSKHSDLLFGYSKFFGGSFIEKTAGANGSTDMSTTYLQYSYRW
jgi:Alginate export